MEKVFASVRSPLEISVAVARTSQSPFPLYDILERFRLKQKFWIDLTFSYICIQMNTKCTLLRKRMSLTSGSEN